MILGNFGIWSRQLRDGDPGEIVEAAAELEELGYGAIWVPGGVETDDRVFADVARLLEATNTIVVATGIVSIWLHDPPALTGAYRKLEAAHPDRFLLGLGVSHRPLMDRVDPGVYDKPLAAMGRYLDGLDAQPEAVPADRRIIAGLGPKMLAVSRERAAGSHPYIMPVAHTAFARGVLGPGPLLAAGVPVVLQPRPGTARQLGRAFLNAPYSGLPNYSNAWLRHGFGDADLRPDLSDALIDGIVAWGEPETAAVRLREHLTAGADHVCLHVVESDRSRLPREGWRRMASALW